MKNILLILVGGTICTALNESGTLSISEKSGAKLKADFLNSDSPYKNEVNIDLSENLFILSENMTVNAWNKVIETYRKYTKEKQYDGIIFAHGTDTLGFSASLFSMILSDTKTPVFFVSANARLDSPRSNGTINFKSAIELICMGIPANVYAVYKNISDGRIYLHLGSRLTQCKNYSDDFYSVGAMDISGISKENCGGYFDKIKSNYPADNRKSFIDINDDWSLKECVLMIDPYVGINYDTFDYSRFKAVLHGTYHSGTACVEKTAHYSEYSKNSILYMIDRCSGATPPVDVYFSPSTLKGEIYETVETVSRHNADSITPTEFLYGFTKETAYAKLLLAYSIFGDRRDRLKFIKTECNFEIIV